MVPCTWQRAALLLLLLAAACGVRAAWIDPNLPIPTIESMTGTGYQINTADGIASTYGW